MSQITEFQANQIMRLLQNRLSESERQTLELEIQESPDLQKELRIMRQLKALYDQGWIPRSMKSKAGKSLT